MTNYLYSENRSLKRLKDIPAEKWDKVTTINLWFDNEKQKGISWKIANAKKLVEWGEDKEGKGTTCFTREGLGKIKRFVDADYEFCTDTV